MPRVANHVNFVPISLAKRDGLRWVGLTKNYPNHLGRCSVLVLGCMSILMENSLGSPKLKQLGGHDPDPRATGFPEWAPFQGLAPQRPMNWGKWNIPGSLTSVQPCLPLCGTCAKPSAPQPSSTTAKLDLAEVSGVLLSSPMYPSPQVELYFWHSPLWLVQYWVPQWPRFRSWLENRSGYGNVFLKT